jgi:CheY-like chemotaxis protein
VAAPADKKVLVVEDNPINQRVALRMLTKLGHRADTVGNGLEALRELIDTDAIDPDVANDRFLAAKHGGSVRQINRRNRRYRSK